MIKTKTRASFCNSSVVLSVNYNIIRGIYAIWWRTNVFVKIFVPPCVAFSRGLRVTFKFVKARRSCYSYEFLLGYSHRKRRPKRSNFLMGILNNEGLLDSVI